MDTANPDYALDDINFSCDTVAIDLPFNLNSDSFHDFAALSQSDVIADFEGALAAWSSTGAPLWLNPGDLDSSALGYDYIDSVLNVSMLDGPNDLGGSDAIATTILTGAGEDLEPIAIDCDILFWTEDASEEVYAFAANAVPEVEEVDLEFVFAHELGHCVGIADQWDDAEFADAVMFFPYTTGTDFTGLGPDEIAAALSLYGEDA